MDRKEKSLQKYLDKKKRQLNRDEILEQIAALDNISQKNPEYKMAISSSLKIKSIKKIKNQDKDSFEKKIFEESSQSQINSESGVSDHLESKIEIFESSATQENLVGNQMNEGNENETIIMNDDEHLKIESETLNGNNNLFISKYLLNEEFLKIDYKKRMHDFDLQRKGLDIFYKQEEIISEIKRNLVTVIRGNTGCGKTTQIPQFLFEYGFTSKGKIALTQPRRISAISVSARINKELNDKISGYKIKYESNISAKTKIKVMTDGMLIQEIKQDFLLSEYSVIILDEVHERTTNIDILIGLLSKIVLARLSQGNVLRLILMSATIEFDHFERVLSSFNTISLDSKSPPVSIFYEDKTNENYLQSCFFKINSILSSQYKFNKKQKQKNSIEFLPLDVENTQESSILVFLPTKDDIYSLKKILEEALKDIIVIPLHSSLTKSDQSLVYKKYDCRKIVLATNIAETSITIDDVVFVIDSGRSKHKIKEENCLTYKIDFISKSSAKQRAGRAGRVKPGICFRLYDIEAFNQFRDYNSPQILNEPLDSVILSLKSLGIRNILSFPFISSPSLEAIKIAIESLQNIGTIDENGNVTKLGKSVSLLPLEPRLGIMLCLKDIEDISYEISLIVSFIALGFELKKTSKSLIFYENSSSDLITYLKVFKSWITDPKSIIELGISSDILEEVKKLSKYLIKISNFRNVDYRLELPENTLQKICKMIFYAFSDHYAVKSDDYFIYGEKTLSISKDSISVSSKNIIFEHLVRVNNKILAKNITLVDKKWF